MSTKMFRFLQRFAVWLAAIAFSVEPFFQAMQGFLDRRLDHVLLWLLACLFLFAVAIALEKLKAPEAG